MKVTCLRNVLKISKCGIHVIRIEELIAQKNSSQQFIQRFITFSTITDTMSSASLDMENPYDVLREVCPKDLSCKAMLYHESSSDHESDSSDLEDLCSDHECEECSQERHVHFNLELNQVVLIEQRHLSRAEKKERRKELREQRMTKRRERNGPCSMRKTKRKQ